MANPLSANMETFINVRNLKLNVENLMDTSFSLYSAKLENLEPMMAA